MRKASGASAPTVDDYTGELPLFFRKPAVLDAAHHGKAGISPDPDYSFAAHSNSILVNAVEFYELCKFYPIVYTSGATPAPCVVVGLEHENYFIGRDGQWQGESYIPAYVRKYPFTFLDIREDNNFVLCIDEAAPQYRDTTQGNTLALFLNGQATPVCKHALEFCVAYQKDFQVTQIFCEELQKAGLLEPMRFDMQLLNGRDIHIGGFQAINEKKVQALPDETVVEFFRKGWLPLIYASLMSHGNWKQLGAMANRLEKARAN